MAATRTPNTPTPPPSGARGGWEVERVPLPPDEEVADAAEDDFEALSVALSKEDPPAVVFGASDGFEADVDVDVDVVRPADDPVEPVAGLVALADDAVPAGFAVVSEVVEEEGFDDVDEVVEDVVDDAVDEDVVAAGFSAGLAATFSGFKSIVTGRLEPVPLDADCDVEPVVPDFGGSPEPAVPEEEDLPLAGSLSDAISTPPAPILGVPHPTIHTCPPENTVPRSPFPQCRNQDSPGLG
jgi:hypothetical protein